MVSTVKNIVFDILPLWGFLSWDTILNVSTPHREFFHISPVPDYIEAEPKEEEVKARQKNPCSVYPNDMGLHDESQKKSVGKIRIKGSANRNLTV